MLNILFSIPIYFRTKMKYYNDEKRKINHEKGTLEKFYRDRNDVIERQIQQMKFPPWEFNDIIGYIQIYENEGYINVQELLEIVSKRFYYYPAGRKNRKYISINPEGISLDFEKKCRALPIAISKKTTDELRETLINLLFELQELKRKEKQYLYIDNFIRIIHHLDIMKFINNKKIV